MIAPYQNIVKLCYGHPAIARSEPFRFGQAEFATGPLKVAMSRFGDWTIEIIKRSDTAKGFEVLPRRWVVERTFAWLGRSRRLAKDGEKSIASAEAWVFIAHIRLLTRRLARCCYVS